MNKLRHLLPILAALSLLLSACGGSAPAETASTAEPVPATTATPEPTEAPPPIPEGLVISEILASNGSFPDDQGGFPDLVELHNTSVEDRDLSGWGLSDSESRIKFRFPEGTVLASDAYLVIPCDKRSEKADTAPFSLSKSGGETVVLVDPLDRTADRVKTFAMSKDHSMIRSDGDWVPCDRPTPGYENSEAGWLAWQESQVPRGPLAIWELMSGNDYLLPQYPRSYFDWCELRNLGDEPLELEGWSLTDDPDEPRAFVFTKPQTLNPGASTLVLMLGGGSTYSQLPCADFGLNAQEDRLYLYDPEGKLVDCLRAYGIPYRGSLGRMEGQNGSFYFATPSPGADNGGEGCRSLAPTPTADAAPGVYDNVDSVTVTLSGPGEIRYTTNGSLPTEKSPLYEAPLELSKTAVIRARCYVPGYLPSDTATLNYIINEGHSLPVVCLDMAPADFDGPQGIYKMTESHFEVYANVSLFELDGSGFSIDCGAKLHGAGSRKAYAKKSFKLNFRSRYDGALDYDVFGGGDITGYDSLLLRGGSLGNGNVMLKDPLVAMAANAASDTVLCLDTRYVILYVNARYWGIYSIREAYSERYAVDHLGGDEDEVQIIQGPLVDDQSAPDLKEIFLYAAKARDGQEGYDWAAARMDLDYMTDWVIFEAFFTNMDINGNVRYIRGGPDGLWHYALFDLDESLYDDRPSWDYALGRGWQYAKLPNALLQNPIYREQFLARLSELLQGGLSAETLVALVDRIYVLLDPEIPRDAERWGSLPAWEGCIRRFRNNFQTRGEQLALSLKRRMQLTDEEYEKYFGFFSETS